MNFKLRVWRQENQKSKGKLVDYDAPDISPHTSLLGCSTSWTNASSFATKNQSPLIPIVREGICGTCSLTINGEAHGPNHPAAVCQLYMWSFKDGVTIVIEPFRARAFPLVRDLVVDRSALDRIVAQAGGFISARTGSAPEANSILVPKHQADLAMEAAACIGCGACVAQCPNASAMLFTGAKVSHLAFLPQGDPERTRRVLGMVRAMDEEGFGNCTNIYECVAVCPTAILGSVMAKMYWEYGMATLRETGGE